MIVEATSRIAMWFCKIAITRPEDDLRALQRQRTTAFRELVVKTSHKSRPKPGQFECPKDISGRVALLLAWRKVDFAIRVNAFTRRRKDRLRVEASPPNLLWNGCNQIQVVPMRQACKGARNGTSKRLLLVYSALKLLWQDDDVAPAAR